MRTCAINSSYKHFSFFLYRQTTSLHLSLSLLLSGTNKSYLSREPRALMRFQCSYQCLGYVYVCMCACTIRFCHRTQAMHMHISNWARAGAKFTLDLIYWRAGKTSIEFQWMVNYSVTDCKLIFVFYQRTKSIAD